MINRNLMVIVLFAMLGLYACGGEQATEATREGRIFDKADVLTEQQEDSIFQLIKDTNDKVGAQIGVMTVDTITESINLVSLKEAVALHLGRTGRSDGILILLVIKNKGVRIEVGRGLEKIIKDETAARIIRETMVPDLRNLKYGTAIYKGVDSLRHILQGNVKP